MTKTYKIAVLSEEAGAAKIEKAVISVLNEGEVRTADLGGLASTSEMANAIAAKIKAA